MLDHLTDSTPTPFFFKMGGKWEWGNLPYVAEKKHFDGKFFGSTVFASPEKTDLIIQLTWIHKKWLHLHHAEKPEKNPPPMVLVTYRPANCALCQRWAASAVGSFDSSDARAPRLWSSPLPCETVPSAPAPHGPTNLGFESGAEKWMKIHETETFPAIPSPRKKIGKNLRTKKEKTHLPTIKF